ncbi:MAG TPA: glycosyltransferase [Gaiellaceae bacterium]|nr:glycosyltransferase [Gaiellaceae bacterium]
MTERPLVSVIMPAYNGVELVAESIESVLAQTYDPIELVVVDDASTDGTPDVVAQYAERHPDRVRLEQKSSRLGPCRRRNDALDLARGELVAWLDQDDLWLPEKTERQVEVLLARPEVGLVYSGYEAFDSESGETLSWRDRESEAEGDVLVPLFVRGCFVASLTALFRRDVLARRHLRLRETDFSFGDDYYLWLALSLDWQVARLDEVLARYRRHPRNESSRLSETNFHLRRIELLRDFVADFPEAAPKLGPWRRRGIAGHYLRAAAFEATTSRLRAALPAARAIALAPAYTLRSLRATDGHAGSHS